jgi:DNA-binding MarR family transcriptional regulator
VSRHKSKSPPIRKRDLPLAAYRSLSEFRHQVRCFLRYSEDASRALDVEPQQHQLLLAIKGLPKGKAATIGELAERLQIRHHSAVELINRLVETGRIVRESGTQDRREVMVRLTPEGERILRDLSVEHQTELTRTGPKLMRALAAAMKLAKAKEK